MVYNIDLTNPGYFWQMRRLEKGQKPKQPQIVRPIFIKLLMVSICVFVLFYR